MLGAFAFGSRPVGAKVARLSRCLRGFFSKRDLATCCRAVAGGRDRAVASRALRDEDETSAVATLAAHAHVIAAAPPVEIGTGHHTFFSSAGGAHRHSARAGGLAPRTGRQAENRVWAEC